MDFSCGKKPPNDRYKFQLCKNYEWAENSHITSPLNAGSLWVAWKIYVTLRSYVVFKSCCVFELSIKIYFRLKSCTMNWIWDSICMSQDPDEQKKMCIMSGQVSCCFLCKAETRRRLGLGTERPLDGHLPKVLLLLSDFLWFAGGPFFLRYDAWAWATWILNLRHVSIIFWRLQRCIANYIQNRGTNGINQ